MRKIAAHSAEVSLVMVVEENEQEEDGDEATWKRRGKGSRGEVREEEPCSERGRWKDGERTREMHRLMLVEGGGGGRGECVRMLSADSSRPEDHTARPPCVPSAFFANISTIKHWAE